MRANFAHSAFRLHVLRLASVFEPPPDATLDGRFDPIGGMQTHTAALTRQLAAHGVRQVVVTTNPVGETRRHTFANSAAIIRVGLPVSSLRQFYAAPALAAVMRAASNVDLIHVHQGEDIAVIPIAVTAATVHRLPLVVTVHCSLKHTFAGRGVRGAALRTIGGRVESAGLPRADAVITLTTRTADRLRRDGLERVRIRVIPSGFEPGVFAGPHPDPLPSVGRPRVVFVGRIAYQKGVLDLVRAAPMISRRATIVLVGDGPQKRAVEREISAHGLRDRVFPTGFVPHARVAGYLAHADVLVLPSRYEELGCALVEGLVSGVPIVASDAGGIPEVIQHGRTGLLFPPGRPRAIAAAVNCVLHDPALAARFVEAGIEVSARYDWARLAGRVLDVYDEIVGSRRATPSGEAFR